MPDTFDPSLLDVCEQEHLDRIGAIQPFGVLLGGDAGDQRIRVASADAASWLGLPGNGVLNRPLGALLPIKLSDFPAEPGQKRILPGWSRPPGAGWMRSSAIPVRIGCWNWSPWGRTIRPSPSRTPCRDACCRRPSRSWNWNTTPVPWRTWYATPRDTTEPSCTAFCPTTAAR